MRGDAIQLDLIKPTNYQMFLRFLQTPYGRSVANRFIRIAYGCWKRGKRIGAKAIWERLRWNQMMRYDESELSEDYRLNNNYTAYMARLAMDREPKLGGFFATREISDVHSTPRRALVVMLRDRRA
jgi:hypothetical protein